MKKFISMALALVMTLSLCTFVVTPKADAAFEDTGELAQYSKQAIDVIQTIQIMDGTGDGQFSPEAGLTRQAAAKIICNMILGPATAKALPTNDNPFPDVAAGSTFSGYISYCKQQGIISGYSDGSFKGSEPLSGYAYLKMLLGALGYASSEEGFTGSNWKVNVAKIALGIGLNKGIPDEVEGEEGAELEGQITREAAAIYAFNTLQADMVEYEGKNTLEINGVKVTMGGANAVPQTWNTSATSIDNIGASRSDGNNQRPIVQFAERYFDKLRREPNGYHSYTVNGVRHEEYESGRDEYTPDDFGRPSVRWFWKGIEIGTYPREPDYVFVGNAKVNTIYEGLGMTSGDDGAYLYINSSIPNNMALNVARSNDKDLNHSSNLLMDGDGNSQDVYGDGGHYVDRIGDGTLVECFRNDANNHVDVCVISVYGGKVSAVKPETAKKNAYVTIDYGMPATTSDKQPRRPDTITISGNNEYETEEFEENDVVAYTYSDSAEEIKSMYKMPDSEIGTLTGRIHGRSIELDDEPYLYGKEYTFHEINEYENGLSSRSSYVIYMFNWLSVPYYEKLGVDDDLYVLWVEEDEFAVEQYVLIERISIETTSASGAKTTTASVIGGMETPADLNDNTNAPILQTLYQQSKAALGNSTWDARARLRFYNGTVRTVTLDDSKNYRTSTADDAQHIARAGGVYQAVTPGYKWTQIHGQPVDNNPDEYQLQYDGTINGTANGGVVYGTNYYATHISPVYVGYNTGAGVNQGNWISEDFTAGHIVRATLVNGVYKLHAIPDMQAMTVLRFGMQDKVLGTLRFPDNRGEPTVVAYNSDRTDAVNGGKQVNVLTDPTARRIVADSETYFVVEDTINSTWKTYVGVKNAPDVSKNNVLDANNNLLLSRYDTTAYVYHRNDVAKLIYITTARVSTSGNDVVFLAANTASKRITATDIDDYYNITAVEKNEVKTLSIKAGVTVSDDNTTYRPGTGHDSEPYCVLLNDVNYDSNDLMTYGVWDSTNGYTAHKAQGIRRINDEEIRVGTHHDETSILRDLAENAKIYMVVGDDIDQIDVDEIVNDTMDMVYYVFYKGEVTHLFIVDYEDEVAAPSADLWANGELELLDPEGNRTHYAYHYVLGNAGTANISAALQQTLWEANPGALNTVQGISATTNGYNIMVDFITYNITLVQDGHEIVTGEIQGITPSRGSNLPFSGVSGDGKITNVTGTKESFKVYDAQTQQGGIPYRPHEVEYIAGSEVKLTVTVTPGTQLETHVYERAAGGGKIANAVDLTTVTSEASRTVGGAIDVTFTVPNTTNGFVVEFATV